MDSLNYIKQAESYFANLAISLKNIEDKIQYLMLIDVGNIEYSSAHRKLIKMLTRATTNTRLFQHSLAQLENIPAELISQSKNFSTALTAFSQRFFMRTTLPTDADRHFKDLPFASLQHVFEHFLNRIDDR